MKNTFSKNAKFLSIVVALCSHAPFEQSLNLSPREITSTTSTENAQSEFSPTSASSNLQNQIIESHKTLCSLLAQLESQKNQNAQLQNQVENLQNQLLEASFDNITHEEVEKLEQLAASMNQINHILSCTMQFTSAQIANIFALAKKYAIKKTTNAAN